MSTTTTCGDLERYLIPARAEGVRALLLKLRGQSCVCQGGTTTCAAVVGLTR